MPYSIQIKASAVKALRRLGLADRSRLTAAIDRLADEPHAGSVLKGEYQGLRRLRVGRYRIVYEARDRELTILVVRVAHRRESYRVGPLGSGEPRCAGGSPLIWDLMPPCFEGRTSERAECL